MELHAHDVAPFNRRGKRLDVFRDCRSIRGDGRLIRVGEVDIFAGLNAEQKMRGISHLERVSADVRNFLFALGEARTGLRETAEAGLQGGFA